MSDSTPAAASPRSLLAAAFHRWHVTPLYLRILGALVVGLVLGVTLGPRAAVLKIPADLILRLLGALAPPLILLAILQALMTAHVGGRQAGRMMFLLVLNTIVAIVIGLLVANVLRPGRGAPLAAPEHPKEIKGDVMHSLLENIPRSMVAPFVDNKVIGIVLIAVAFGIAFRRLGPARNAPVRELVDVAFDAIVVVLHWVIDLVPLGVLGIVAAIIGTEGFEPFKALGLFVVAVLAALTLHATYYLVRIRLGSWVPIGRLIRGTRDALVMAFSTASSTATMPVTYECLTKRVGLRDESARMGSLVGANFNNDGTALYEAMAALFIAQMLGMDLTLWQQVIVVLTSVIASVGAAGIPEAGLVTMALVFRAVNLPIEYISLLLAVDWFLDRCRTAINVMGDMNVSCLLDGRTPPETLPPPPPDDDTPAAEPGPAVAVA